MLTNPRRARFHPKLSIFDAVQTPSEHRIQALSDGVFAIAMTLLVLELKLPEFPHSATSSQFADAIWSLWPKVGVFILSFIIAARAWELHRYVFNFVLNYDHTIIYLNMIYLMAVAFLPFTTSLVGEHSNLGLAVAIYSANFLMFAGTKLVIWSYATTHHRLVSPKLSAEVIGWLKKRLVFSCGVILSAILAALFYPQLGILVLIVYQLVMVIIPFFRKNVRAR